MRIKRFGLTATAMLLIAATPPPTGLTTYIHDGMFDPGDYGWMRGRFAEASDTDRNAALAITDWSRRCMAAEQSRIRGELIAQGIADPKLTLAPYQDALCRDVTAAAVDTQAWPTFKAFIADVAAARPVFETVLWTTALAVDKGGPRGADLAQKLLARPLGEQILRTSLGWGDGEPVGTPPMSPPPLSLTVRAIVVSRIGLAIGRSDRINTDYLKQIVGTSDWPKRSVVGEHAADAAWLLVQHADDDPVFQLHVLRLMEPLVATGEVSKTNNAYLYDRVMLKIAGIQRYATQMTCRGGHRIPLPLEDAVTVDARRIAVGMEPLADYAATMDRLYGRCPPEIPATPK